MSIFIVAICRGVRIHNNSTPSEEHSIMCIAMRTGTFTLRRYSAAATLTIMALGATRILAEQRSVCIGFPVEVVFDAHHGK
jgi:hypothetical protein